jgi:hypothetical protein
MWGQYGDETRSRIKLSTDALTLSVCRGWVSRKYPDQDAGLVVAYIKSDGTVWYRQLLGIVNNEENWDKESQRTEVGIGNTFVHISRLNDCRMAFTVTGATEITVVITEQFYSQPKTNGDGNAAIKEEP